MGSFSESKHIGGIQHNQGYSDCVKQVFHSLYVMMCLLTSPEDGPSDVIDAHVKIFLSCCNRFVISYRGKDTVPFWSTTGNFPSLLNLGSQISGKVSVRMYWEGNQEKFR